MLINGFYQPPPALTDTYRLHHKAIKMSHSYNVQEILMGLPAELQAQIIGYTVQLNAPVLSSETNPADNNTNVLDNMGQCRIPNPVNAFRATSQERRDMVKSERLRERKRSESMRKAVGQFEGIAEDEFYRVNTFHIDTTDAAQVVTSGSNCLWDDVRQRKYIRHIEYHISTEAIITRWAADNKDETKEISTVDELQILEQFPKRFESLKTITVRFELPMDELCRFVCEFQNRHGGNQEARVIARQLRKDLVTTVLQTYRDIDFPRGNKGPIRKFLQVDLNSKAPTYKKTSPSQLQNATTPQPIEIDGRHMGGEELYEQMLQHVKAVVRI